MKNEYDFLKTVAILLVVIGHTTILFDTAICSAVTKGIYLFHMPLFMAMSGAVYGIGRSKGKYADFLPFFKKKVLRLLLPYLFAGLCVLAPALIGLGKMAAVDAYSGIALGNDCRHLWFLLSLFSIFMIAWALEKFKVPTLLSFVGALLLVPICTSSMGETFYSFNNTIYYLPSFLLGMLMQKYPLKDAKTISAEVLLIFVAALVIKLQDFWYADALCSLVMSNAIVALLVSLARKVCPLQLQETNYYKQLSSYSFGIYLFHVPVIYAMVQLLGGINLHALVGLSIIVSIVLSILLTYIIRKIKLNILIGV